MRTHVRFKSDLFKPLKPEEEQVNPEVYGEELSKWIHDNIHKFGPKAQSYFGEDWGWMVVFGREYPAWIGCGNGDKNATEWFCFCEPFRSFTDRLFRRPLPEKELNELVNALNQLLNNEARISNIEWFSSDDRGREFDFSNTPF